MKSKSLSIQRRQFIQTFAYAAAAGCGLKQFCGQSAIGALLPEPASGAGYVKLKVEDYAELGANNQTLRLGFTAISGGGNNRKPVNTRFYPLLITRSSPGNYMVVDSNCTHAGWMVTQSGSTLRCPVHNSRFQFDGTRISGPASSPLKSYKSVWRPDIGTQGELAIEVPRLGYSVEMQPIDADSDLIELKFLARQSIPYQIMFRDTLKDEWSVVEHTTSSSGTPNQTDFIRSTSDGFANVFVAKPSTQGFFGVQNLVNKV